MSLKETPEVSIYTQDSTAILKLQLALVIADSGIISGYRSK